MVIVKLSGGLGNQMFQFAFAYSLALKYKSRLIFEKSSFLVKSSNKIGHTPRSFELGIFSIEYDELCKYEINKLLYGKWNKIQNLIKLKKQIKIIQEEKFGFNESYLNVEPPIYLDGYFQSEKYFYEYAFDLKHKFIFPIENCANYAAEFINQILTSKCPISIHFRRGDYVSDPQFNEEHGICSLEYYQNAINYFIHRYDNVTFFIFSDEIEIIKKDLELFNINKVYVQHFKPIPNWIDMMLISMCRHHIIANSSYSWWGAWLGNESLKEVIAPRKWFSGGSFSDHDIIPENWLRI